MLPLLQAREAKGFTVQWGAVTEYLGAVLEDWEVVVSPSRVASARDKLPIFIDQLAEIQFLLAAAGVGRGRRSSKGDAPTIPTLEQLLDKWQGLNGAPLRPVVIQRKSAVTRNIEAHASTVIADVPAITTGDCNLPSEWLDPVVFFAEAGQRYEASRYR